MSVEARQLPSGCDCKVYSRNNQILAKYDVSFHRWLNESTSLHCHDFYEFFIITEHGALHELNGKTSRLSKGTLCMIRPDDCHKFIKDDGMFCDHINFCITPGHLELICRALKIPLSELIAENEIQVNLNDEEYGFFSERAKLITNIMLNRPENCSPLICDLVARAVFCIFIRRTVSGYDCPAWFSRLLEKINSPENTLPGAKEVYVLAGFSPASTIAYFKKYTGKTVSEYLTGIKCTRACYLLKSTELSIIEIAGASGYNSLSHFNKTFKSLKGVTPSAYRKQSSSKPHSQT